MTNKGKKYGTCNMSYCITPELPVTWFNHGSRAYYCEHCASILNNDSFNKRDAQELFGHELCTNEDN